MATWYRGGVPPQVVILDMSSWDGHVNMVTSISEVVTSLQHDDACIIIIHHHGIRVLHVCTWSASWVGHASIHVPRGHMKQGQIPI